MKSDMVIERIHIIPNSLLLGKTCPRNLDGFQTRDIDTATITYSIYMWFQVLINEFGRSEKSIIEP